MAGFLPLDAQKRILISGASGFVGSALVKWLSQGGNQVIGLNRQDIDSTSASGAFRGQLMGTQAFIHLAARTHSSDLRKVAAIDIYREVNVGLTMKVARACAGAGVRRFVFISSVKACGERTHGEPLSEAVSPAPEDAYGRSKLEAEEHLLELGTHTDMEVVILRPPLVYGPGVKGNLLKLLRLIDRGTPLPFASVRNRRSLVGLQNFVDVIGLCANAPEGFAGRFFVSDDSNTSTPELISKIAGVMQRAPHLLHVSPAFLNLLAGIVGKRQLADRLLGDLEIDSSLIRSRLDWRPRVSMIQELTSTVHWYLQNISDPPKLG